MTDALDTFEYADGWTIEVHLDDNAETPRDWDNVCTFVLSHRRYDLPHEADVEGESLDELIQDAVAKHDARFFFPVWGYDHGALHLKAGARTYPFDDRWDSGCAGIVFITNAKVEAEYQESETYPTADAWALAVAQGEVEVYDQWANGEVYGFEVIDPDGVVVDACWGFYEIDYLKAEAEAYLPDDIKETK